MTRWLPLLVVGLLLVAYAPGGADETKLPRPNKDKDKVKHEHADKVDEFLKRYDKDGDGYLTRKELPERFAYYFDRIDTNRDGKLSRAELLEGWVYMQPRRRPSDVVGTLASEVEANPEALKELQRMYDLLRKMDTAKDGKLSPDEAKAFRRALAKERVDWIFEELDTNKDGKISKTEARGLLKTHFAELDADKDGFISRAELLKASLDWAPKASKKDGKDVKKDAPPRKPSPAKEG